MEKLKLLNDLKNDAHIIDYTDYSSIDKFKRRFRMVTRLIFGEDSCYINDFNRLSFSPPQAVAEFTGGEYVIKSRTSGREGILQLIDTMLEEILLIGEPQTISKIGSKSEKNNRDRIFIIHGHDIAAKNILSRFLEELELDAIIFQEQPNMGKTIIEKFEDLASEVCFAIALLTPDDIASAKSNKNQSKPRARQNVIFELGYFCGKLKRKNICVLYKESVEIPSDYSGIVLIEMDEGGAWQFHLSKEMKQAGLNFDFNKVISPTTFP